MDFKRLLSSGVKILLVIALIAGISGACGGTPADVTVTRIGPREIKETVMVAGNLVSTNPTQVMPLVSGLVEQVHVEDGQQVAAGQELVQLDTSNLEQALLSAKGSLESIQSMASMVNSLSSAASGVSQSINDVMTSVDAGVEGLYALEKALIPLLPEEQRLIALQAVEESYQEYVAARAGAPSVSVGTAGYSTGAQQASANKAIENAQEDIEAATITAPTAGTLLSVTGGTQSIESMMAAMMSSFSGMIPSGLDITALTGLSGGLASMGFPSSGPLVPGSYVVPGTPIFNIVDLKNMSLVATVDETDITKVDVHQAAVVTLEAYPEETFEGLVVKVADTATTNEAGATAFEVTIQMDPTDFNLKLGMTGIADVVIATKKDALVVPVEAVVEKEGEKYVFKVVDGKARLTKVTLGLSTEADVEIVTGVEKGDRVVTKGAEKIKDGQSVKVDSE